METRRPNPSILAFLSSTQAYGFSQTVFASDDGAEPVPNVSFQEVVANSPASISPSPSYSGMSHTDGYSVEDEEPLSLPNLGSPVGSSSSLEDNLQIRALKSDDKKEMRRSKSMPVHGTLPADTMHHLLKSGVGLLRGVSPRPSPDRLDDSSRRSSLINESPSQRSPMARSRSELIAISGSPTTDMETQQGTKFYWPTELHDAFLNAYEELGGLGSAREIYDLMCQTSGSLTVYQVQCHLRLYQRQLDRQLKASPAVTPERFELGKPTFQFGSTSTTTTPLSPAERRSVQKVLFTSPSF